MTNDNRDWKFRADVQRLEQELAKAKKRLEIAERQRENGQLTTGMEGYNKSFFKSDEELRNDGA